MSKYYFCCSLPLEIGSVVNPGNWGRMMMNYTPATSNPWVLVRELAYEEVRKEKFPEKPSRLECIYLCSSEHELREFMDQNGRMFDIAYEVELVDDASRSHIGCLETSNIGDHDNFMHFKSMAERYWSGENIMSPEFITLSPIRIVREL
ncbi:conserved hypothetical protein [Vibrio chagasii]|nr:conserved hypothetical protein [Vibrio chagasii]CAH6926620.1 conserved hypothetical protein [Vibrio chagasii]CAH6973570.1 conserved hypothetical protein [Vibrio chagasii]CAH7140440.1 conserved hypothetical protein [Vibrio chagasii]CAH7227054.1 conserved hypothetical protein [Vibrio chagasii]